MEDFTKNSIKWTEGLICMLTLLIMGTMWFYIYSNWVGEENYASVNIETQNFLDSCSKTGIVDKESFDKLCKTAKENKMEIKIGVNSRKLTIDQDNPPENLYFSNKDTIIVLATGVGRSFIEVFKHDPINGQPVKDYRFANIV